MLPYYRGTIYFWNFILFTSKKVYAMCSFLFQTFVSICMTFRLSNTTLTTAVLLQIFSCYMMFLTARGMFWMWDVHDVGCSGCGMSGMWNVADVGYLGCGMFEICNVQGVRCSDVGCLGCGMLEMLDIWNVGCSKCVMFGMLNVHEGCLLGCGILVYKMPLFIAVKLFKDLLKLFYDESNLNIDFSSNNCFKYCFN